MSGVVSVGAAVAATALAASTVAEVGLTVGAAFAIAGAVGATAFAAGNIFKIPELKYAGLALGAVGGIGAIASAAGVFGSEAAGITDLATDSGTWLGAGSGLGEGGGEFASVGDLMQARGIGTEIAPAIGGGGAPTAEQVESLFNNTNDVTAMTTSPTPFGTAVPTGTPNVPTGVVEGTTAAETTSPIGQYTPSNPMVDTLGQVQPTAPGGPLLGQQPPTQANVPEGFGLDQNGNLVRIPQGDPNIGNEGLNAPGDVARTAGQNQEQSLLNQQPTSQATVKPGEGPVQPSGWQGIGGGTSPALKIGTGTMDMTGGADKGTFGNILDYIGKHPVMLLGALQAGGSFLSGATSSLTPAQVSALDAQAAQNRAAATLYQQQQQLLAQQQARANEPMPVAYRPTPLIRQTPKPQGVSPGPLNSPVTGVPA